MPNNYESIKEQLVQEFNRKLAALSIVFGVEKPLGISAEEIIESKNGNGHSHTAEESEVQNKSMTGLIREFIHERGRGSFTMKDIKTFLISSGLPPRRRKTDSISSILSLMKSAGSIIVTGKTERIPGSNAAPLNIYVAKSK